MPSSSSTRSNSGQASSAASAQASSQVPDPNSGVPSAVSTAYPDALPSMSDFHTIFKHKRTYVKKRVTILDNALLALEDESVTVQDDDITLAKSYLNALDDALATLNRLVDDNVPLLSDDDLDVHTKLCTDYVPKVIRFRSRINNLTAITPVLVPDVSVPPPVQPMTNQRLRGKIDNAFKPQTLDVTATPPLFDKWKREFMVYLRRNDIDNAPNDEQRMLLNNCLTAELENDLSRVCLLERDATVPQIMASLEKYFKESNNLMTRRCDYFNCCQRENESIRGFIARFRSLGDFAEFDNFSYKSNMACKLLTGIKDDELRCELLRLKDTSYEAIYDYAIAWESSKTNSSKIKNSHHSRSFPNREDTSEVNKLSAYKNGKNQAFRRQNAQSNTLDAGSQRHQRVNGQGKSSFRCQNCGRSSHKNGSCPAKDMQCDFCSRMGHFSKVCRQRMTPTGPSSTRDLSSKNNRGGKIAKAVRAVMDAETSDDQADETDDNDVNVLDFDVFNVSGVRTAPPSHSFPRPTPKVDATFHLGDRFLGRRDILPDTGASVSVMPTSLMRQWNLQSSLVDPQCSLRSVNGEPLSCKGIISIDVKIRDISSTVDFYVCSGISTVLLSWYALQPFDIVHEVFPGPIPRHHAPVATLRGNSDASNRTKFFIQCYPCVFQTNSTFNVMKGSSMHIHLRDDIDYSNIRQVYKPRPIPIPLRPAVKSQIDAMISQGIITPVQAPTTFVSPLLVVPKKGGKVRLVVDYTELNKNIHRPVHPFPSVPEVRALIPPTATHFAVLDAVQGYWQIPLHKKSQHLTTFLTPWGRFCYTRAPMGLSSSGDEFCRRGDIAFNGIPNIVKVIDDILVYADSQEELELSIHEVLKAAQKHNISLSPEKFVMGETVSFVGMSISSLGIRPDEKHLEAIAQFPAPKNKTDLRSFMGLINQFSNFSPSIAGLSKAFRHLLSKNSTWRWETSHDEAFKKIRNILIRAPVLRYFDVSKQTKLLTDASKLNGLGFVLMQKSSSEEDWGLVSCGSRFLTQAESNYAVCEMEALAIAWAIKKCRVFLMGLPHFDVYTDHRPLISIFNSTTLAKYDNPRLLRLMQQVATYSFKVHWVPGRHNKIPDALSRAPVQTVADNSGAFSLQHPGAAMDPILKDISDKALQDHSYQDLLHAVKSMTQRDIKRLPASTHSHIRQFASVWSRLSSHRSSGLVILDSHRIVVPPSYRKQLLSSLHVAHQGISRTRARVQSLYFWPGITNDIVQLVQGCGLCQRYKESQPVQPMTMSAEPDRPFQFTSCDLFEFGGHHSLVYVDRFSGWPCVAHFSKLPSSSQIISALTSFFQDFGVPVSIRHDGARHLVSTEFTDFLKKYGITDELSSAYNPRSNGHAEAAVKSIKSILKKCWLHKSLDKKNFSMALLEYRCTPKLPGGLSPAEMVFGRQIRSMLPMLNFKRYSHNQIQAAKKINFRYLANSYRNSNYRCRILPPLLVGDAVRMRDTLLAVWDKEGKVISVRSSGQSYVVESGGKTFIRNRRLLKKIV